ncbi:MAG: phosphohistidine phosphatase SixA [Nitrososphaerales archaeon]
MKLYVMRHGEAEPKNSSIQDEDRHLTKEGRERVKSNLLLAKNNIAMELDVAISSPYTRAQETARLAADVFQLEKIIIEASLEPTTAPYEIYAMLSRIDATSSKSILIISHQPLVTNLLSDLLGSSRISMSTGSLAKIVINGEASSGSGALVWLLPG